MARKSRKAAKQKIGKKYEMLFSKAFRLIGLRDELKEQLSMVQDFSQLCDSRKKVILGIVQQIRELKADLQKSGIARRSLSSTVGILEAIDQLRKRDKQKTIVLGKSTSRSGGVGVYGFGNSSRIWRS